MFRTIQVFKYIINHGPRSPGIVHRKSAINNNLAHKSAPKPTPT